MTLHARLNVVTNTTFRKTSFTKHDAKIQNTDAE